MSIREADEEAIVHRSFKLGRACSNAPVLSSPRCEMTPVGVKAKFHLTYFLDIDNACSIANSNNQGASFKVFTREVLPDRDTRDRLTAYVSAVSTPCFREGDRGRSIPQTSSATMYS